MRWRADARGGARRAAVADAALEESVIVGAGCGGALGADVPGGAAARLGDLVYGLGREMGASTRGLQARGATHDRLR